MATKEMVTKVWIAPGCIVCDACETTAPDVFQVLHDKDTCIIRPEALDMEFTKPRTDTIIQAAQECPVDVIKFDRAPFEEGSVVAVGAAAESAPPTPPSEGGEQAPPVAAGAGAAPAHGPVKPAPAKGHPEKPAAPARPKVLDPAIQALLAATTVRGGHVVIDKDVKNQPDPVKQIAKLTPDKLPPDGRFQRVLEKSQAAKDKAQPSRRDVMLGLGWTAFALGMGGAPLAAFTRFMMPNVLEEPDPKVRCGPVGKYAAMQVGEVNEDFKPVKPSGFWLVREEGRVAAVSIICTHLGCIPNWLPNDHKFKCPCHGSGYTPEGVNFEGPTPRPLERFRIYVEGGEVVVDRSRKFLAMGPTDTKIWEDPDASIPV